MRGGGNECADCTLDFDKDKKLNGVELNADNIVHFKYYEDVNEPERKGTTTDILMKVGSEGSYLNLGTIKLIKAVEGTKVYKSAGEEAPVEEMDIKEFYLNRIVNTSFNKVAIVKEPDFMKGAKTISEFKSQHSAMAPAAGSETPGVLTKLSSVFSSSQPMSETANAGVLDLLTSFKNSIKAKISSVNLDLDSTTDVDAVKIIENLRNAEKYIAPFLQYENIIEKLGLKLENEKVPIDMLESLARLFKVYKDEASVVSAIKNINKDQKVEIHKTSEFNTFIETFKTLANDKGLQAFQPGEKIPETMGNYFIVVGVKKVKVPGGKFASYPVLLMSNGTYTILNEARSIVDRLSSLCPTPSSPGKPIFIEFVQKACLLPDTRLAPRTSIASSTTNSRFGSMFSRKSAPAASATPAAVVAKGGRRTKKRRKNRK
jgi:hypothetical protein